MELRSVSTQLILCMVMTTVLSACSATSDMGAQGSSSQMPVNGNNNGDSDDLVGDVNLDSDTLDTGAATDKQIGDNTALVANAGNVACEASQNEFRDTMLAMVNASRQSARQCGTRSVPATGTVQWSDQLEAAARNHADDMVTVNFFNHTGSDGLGVAERAEASGYNWSAVGENIAAGQRDIAEVHQGWLDSPGHCRNIMNSLYTEIGSACIADDSTDFGTYWVVVFGNPR